MSLRYKGAVISATPPTTTGGNSGTAPGAWTLQQQMQAQAAGTWPSFVPLYIEDVFSTYLYTGNGSTQTITNGINLSTYDGLVWCKNRAQVSSHELSITRSDLPLILRSNATDASQQGDISGFHSAGFFLQNVVGNINQNGQPCVSWTFREQPKFFDVVTYTGTGSATTIPHNLGSVPGCMIVKCTSITSDWFVYHRSLTNAQYLRLNTTGATGSSANIWNSTTPTATEFSVGTGTASNISGETYVAYLFAHDAGGFGLNGTDNVISCGSYTSNGGASLVDVNLGYEPQWILVKDATLGTASSSWRIIDNMRGFDNSTSKTLLPNTSGAEGTTNPAAIIPTATGFTDNNGYSFNPGDTIIYIAIRRGPMKTPTSGTSVFAPVTYTGTGSNTKQVVTTFPPDMVWPKNRSGSDSFAWTRLQGLFGLSMSDTSAQASLTNRLTSWNQNGVTLGISQPNNSGDPYVLEGFQRAPNFFDVVCYTGTGTTTTQNHNLGVAPELIIVKCRSAVTFWYVYSATYGRDYYAFLNDTMGFQSDPGNSWGTTNPTSTTFSLSPLTETNASGSTYVAYLFASCPGVSKVGSYTGTGGTQTINCGFAARFVLIKRGNSTGNWWFWDTAQGMVAGTDPRMALNSTSGQSNADWVFTNASGFQIVTTDATVNASGSTYIYLAIA